MDSALRWGMVGCLLILGCQETPVAVPGLCGEGEVRAGQGCIPLVDEPPQPPRPSNDAGATPVDPPSPAVPEEAPVVVDEWFFPSGFMGDGESGGIATVACTGERTERVGLCHGFEWTPGELGWAGVFWQHPDMNWGEAAGLVMPEGLTSVRFVAWGAEGGESVNFSVGMGDVDGFSVETGTVGLSQSPQTYTIDLRGVEYSAVVGGFSWSAAGRETPATIYIDDIHWSDAPLAGEPPTPMPMPPTPTDPELPLAVDDWFGPSGYMGDGAMGGISNTACPVRGPVEVGICHQFTWFPGSAGWAGVFWQYPDMNWGDLPGLAIPGGALSVRFHAWGAEGGEVVEFGAGMGDVDGFSRSATLTLTTEPTEYVLDLAGVEYTDVVGGFVWNASDSDTPVTFSVDGIHWSTEPAPEMETPPVAVALPFAVDDHFIPAGYIGNVNAISDAECPMDVAEVGCHQFIWSPDGTSPGWGGILWQNMEGSWGMTPGHPVAQGAQAIRFVAWGATGDEIIQVGAGAGVDSTDGFDVEISALALTTMPTVYEIDLSTVDYETVVSAFRWVIESESNQVFFIADIQWVP